MPKLITVQITSCPVCVENEWLMWMPEDGEEALDADKVAVKSRTVANMRESINVGYLRSPWWSSAWPWSVVARFGRKRESGTPSSPEAVRCRRCGFERTFSQSRPTAIGEDSH